MKTYVISKVGSWGKFDNEQLFVFIRYSKITKMSHDIVVLQAECENVVLKDEFEIVIL